MYLSPSTTDGLLYAKPIDGGLGLIKMVIHIPLIQLRRIKHLTESDDEYAAMISKAVISDTLVYKLLNLTQGRQKEGEGPQKRKLD